MNLHVLLIAVAVTSAAGAVMPPVFSTAHAVGAQAKDSFGGGEGWLQEAERAEHKILGRVGSAALRAGWFGLGTAVRAESSRFEARAVLAIRGGAQLATREFGNSGLGIDGTQMIMLTEMNWDEFFRGPRVLKAILFTKKAETPAVWSRLFDSLHAECLFGMVKQEHVGLMSRCGVAEDQLPKVIVVLPSGLHVPYQGPSNFHHISLFIKQQYVAASGGGAGIQPSNVATAQSHHGGTGSDTEGGGGFGASGMFDQVGRGFGGGGASSVVTDTTGAIGVGSLFGVAAGPGSVGSGSLFGAAGSRPPGTASWSGNSNEMAVSGGSGSLFQPPAVPWTSNSAAANVGGVFAEAKGDSSIGGSLVNESPKYFTGDTASAFGGFGSGMQATSSSSWPDNAPPPGQNPRVEEITESLGFPMVNVGGFGNQLGTDKLPKSEWTVGTVAASAGFDKTEGMDADIVKGQGEMKLETSAHLFPGTGFPMAPSPAAASRDIGSLQPLPCSSGAAASGQGGESGMLSHPASASTLRSPVRHSTLSAIGSDEAGGEGKGLEERLRSRVNKRLNHLPSVLDLAEFVGYSALHRTPDGVQEATRLYEQALALATCDKTRVHVLCAYANFLSSRGDAAAEARYKEALEISGCDVTVCYNLAILLDSQEPRRSAEAERLYKRVLKSDPMHIPTLVNYAVLVQEVEGDVNAAEDLYLRALKTAVMQGSVALSFIDLSRSLDLSKVGARGRNGTSVVSKTTRVGHSSGPRVPLDGAKDSPRTTQVVIGGGQHIQAPAASRSVVTALINYGQLVLNERGDVMSAEECVREAVRSVSLAGDKPPAVFGHTQAASQLYSAAHVALANILRKGKGEAIEAENLLKNVLKRCPHDPSALVSYASLIEDEYQDYDAAQELYKRALEGSEGHVPGGEMFRAAVLCYCAGQLANVRQDYPSAEALMQEALVLNPGIKGATAFMTMLQDKQLAATNCREGKLETGYVESTMPQTDSVVRGVDFGNLETDMNAVTSHLADLTTRELDPKEAAENMAREHRDDSVLKTTHTPNPPTPIFGVPAHSTTSTAKLFGNEWGFKSFQTSEHGSGSMAHGIGQSADGERLLTATRELEGFGVSGGEGAVFGSTKNSLEDPGVENWTRGNSFGQGSTAIFGAGMAALKGLAQGLPGASQTSGASQVAVTQPAEGDVEDDGENYAEESFFKPAVSELPPMITVKTGEEDEEILLELRARLFRFDEAAKEWKERGLGPLKILRHRNTGKSRILMRREQTLKICANHHLTSTLRLQPMAASDRAWTYATADWADAQAEGGYGQEEGNETESGGPSTDLLAIRFKSKEEAAQFKEVFESSCTDSVGGASRGGKEHGIETVADDIKHKMMVGPGKDSALRVESDGKNEKGLKCKEIGDPEDGSGVGGRRAPLIMRKGFWEEEGGGGNPADSAPLLRRNAGFIYDPTSAAGASGSLAVGLEVCRVAQEKNAGILHRAEQWVEICHEAKRWLNILDGGGDGPVSQALPEGTRILEADAERTFKNELLRQDMVHMLSRVADGDYHQGLGYLAAFLRLLLPETHALAILWTLRADSDLYIKGYWKGKPEAFVRDAMLFERLLDERLPEVARSLRTAGVVPEAYAQKYFCGLCIHVLPFEPLCKFLEKFLEGGWRYLIKFALAVVSTLKPRIQSVAAGDSSAFLALLRLDRDLFPDEDKTLFNTILETADAMDLGDDDALLQMRAEEEGKLLSKLEAVRAREAEMRLQEEEEEEDNTENSDSGTSEGTEKEEYVSQSTKATDPDRVAGKVKESAPVTAATLFNIPSMTAKSSGLVASRDSRFGNNASALMTPFSFGTSPVAAAAAATPATEHNRVFGNSSVFDPQVSNSSVPESIPSFFGKSDGKWQTEFASIFSKSSSRSPFNTSSTLQSASAIFPPASLAPSTDMPLDSVAPLMENEQENGRKDGAVEIKTGEEEEDVLFNRRAKMFRFDPEKLEWKERGVGDIKLLIHRETEAVRVLMRRDHTFKVCANHVVMPDLKVEAMPGSDKSLTYYTADHSGINHVGEYTGEVFTELFAFRFKSASECEEWKDSIEKCKRREFEGFNRISAMDESQRPVRPVEADVLKEDGSITEPGHGPVLGGGQDSTGAKEGTVVGDSEVADAEWRRSSLQNGYASSSGNSTGQSEGHARQDNGTSALKTNPFLSDPAGRSVNSLFGLPLGFAAGGVGEGQGSIGGAGNVSTRPFAENSPFAVFMTPTGMSPESSVNGSTRKEQA
jgi:tetratricopeptide (TPR) repeat protein